MVKLQDMRKLDQFSPSPEFEELIRERSSQLTKIDLWHDIHEPGIFKKLESIELESEEIEQIPTDPELPELLLHLDHWLTLYQNDPYQTEFLEPTQGEMARREIAMIAQNNTASSRPTTNRFQIENCCYKSNVSTRHPRFF